MEFHAQAAEKVLEAVLMRKFQQQLSADALLRVTRDSETAPAEEVCTMTATVEGMLELSEPYRSWQLTRFVQSLQ